jgi:hypothetical protein
MTASPATPRSACLVHVHTSIISHLAATQLPYVKVYNLLTLPIANCPRYELHEPWKGPKLPYLSELNGYHPYLLSEGLYSTAHQPPH